MRNEYTVVVLGSGGVGKSALTVKYVLGKFVDTYDPTIEDFYQKELLVGDTPRVLRILDTAGTSQFSSLHDLYIKNGDGFLVVYNLTNKQSFNDIRGMRDNIVRIKGLSPSSPLPLVLVGTKADLVRSASRAVDLRETLALANEWMCPHVETSALDNVGVDEVFMEVLTQSENPDRPKAARRAEQLSLLRNGRLEIAMDEQPSADFEMLKVTPKRKKVCCTL